MEDLQVSAVKESLLLPSSLKAGLDNRNVEK